MGFLLVFERGGGWRGTGLNKYRGKQERGWIEAWVNKNGGGQVQVKKPKSFYSFLSNPVFV